MKGFLRYSLALVFLIFVFTGCNSSQSTGKDVITQTESGGKAAADTNDAVVAYVGTAIFDSSLDPIKGAMSYGYSFTNASLLKVDTSSDYVGDMAVSWSISEDALVYTFTLRENVRFSNGGKMTAEDVVFTYETVKERQAENENVDLTRLASITAVDEYIVEFTLSEPYSPFLDTTAMLGIVPKVGYESELFDNYPIGTGPWQVVQYDASQQIIVEPNEYYYEGAPEISRVTLVYLDNDGALAAARSGQLDVVMVSPDYALETVTGMTMVPLETMDIRMVSLPVQSRQEQNGILTGNDVTADINVRQALAIGIDRETIIANAFNGIGKKAVGFTDNLVWAGGAAYEDNRKAEATAILEAAGWTLTDSSGWREKDGIACEFDIYTAADRYGLAAALAEDAAALGIKINVHSAAWDDISTNMNSQGVMWGWGQYSPTVLPSLFDSGYIGSGSYDNVVSYSNEEVDSLIQQALSTDNQEEAIALWQEMQTIADADIPYLYLVNIEHCYFVSDRLDISVNTQIPHPHGHGSPVICNMKDWTWK